MHCFFLLVFAFVLLCIQTEKTVSQLLSQSKIAQILEQLPLLSKPTAKNSSQQPSPVSSRVPFSSLLPFPTKKPETKPTVPLYDYPFMLVREKSKGVADQLFSKIQDPFEAAAQFASGFMSLPVSLLSDSKLSQFLLGENSKPPQSLDEFLEDLQAGIFSIDMLHQGLKIFRDTLYLPLKLFTLAYEDVSQSLTGQSDFALMGLTGLQRMAKGIQQRSATVASLSSLSSGKPITAALILPTEQVKLLIEKADQLYTDLDTLLIMFSNGIFSTLDHAFQDLQKSLVLLLSKPANGTHWLSFSNSLDAIHDILRRMQHSWMFDDATKPIIAQVIKLCEDLIDLLAAQATPLEQTFVTGFTQKIQELLEAIFSLDQLQLTPILSLNGSKLAEILKSAVPDIISLTLSAPIISELIDLTNKTTVRFLELPEKITGVPLFDLDKLNPLVLVESFADFAKQSLDIASLIKISEQFIQETPKALVGTIKDIIDTTETILKRFLKFVSISNAQTTATTLTTNLILFLTQLQERVSAPSSASIFTEVEKPLPLIGKRELLQKQHDISDKLTEEEIQQYQAQKSHLTEKLPILKKEIDLYEQLRRSECDLVHKQLKPLIMGGSIRQDFEHLKADISLVCDDMKFISLSYDFHQLVKIYQQLLVPLQPAKLRSVHQDIQIAAKKFMDALEAENLLAQKRAKLIKDVEAFVPQSKPTVFRF